MTATKQLQQVALMLRNAAPEQWDEFVNKFITYTDVATYAVTAADATEIMTKKGSALQCQALLRLYMECDKQPGTPVP